MPKGTTQGYTLFLQGVRNVTKILLFLPNLIYLDLFVVILFCSPSLCQSPYFIFTLFTLLMGLLVKYSHSHPLYSL